MALLRGRNHPQALRQLSAASRLGVSFLHTASESARLSPHHTFPVLFAAGDQAPATTSPASGSARKVPIPSRRERELRAPTEPDIQPAASAKLFAMFASRPGLDHSLDFPRISSRPQSADRRHASLSRSTGGLDSPPPFRATVPGFFSPAYPGLLGVSSPSPFHPKFLDQPRPRGLCPLGPAWMAPRLREEATDNPALGGPCLRSPQASVGTALRHAEEAMDASSVKRKRKKKMNKHKQRKLRRRDKKR